MTPRLRALQLAAPPLAPIRTFKPPHTGLPELRGGLHHFQVCLPSLHAHHPGFPGCEHGLWPLEVQRDQQGMTSWLDLVLFLAQGVRQGAPAPYIVSVPTIRFASRCCTACLDGMSPHVQCQGGVERQGPHVQVARRPDRDKAVANHPPPPHLTLAPASSCTTPVSRSTLVQRSAKRVPGVTGRLTRTTISRPR